MASSFSYPRALAVIAKAGLVLASGFAWSGCATGGGAADGGRGGMDAAIPARDGGSSPADGGCAVECPPAAVCRGRVCVPRCDPESGCEAGRTCCEGACVNLESSLTDCGGCSASCSGLANLCTAGECRCGTNAPCEAPLLCCQGRCVDLLSDPATCGTCDTRCAAGEVCERGACVVPPCSPACTAEESCVDGVCRCGEGASCGAGQACCGGSCVDVESDRTHCGICNNTCAETQVCAAGGCTDDIPCDPACGPGESCEAGVCRCGGGGACAGGQTCCGGSCVDTSSDAANCGTCGRSCGRRSCCSGSCTDTESDVDNCGGCDRDCGDDADGCTGGGCSCGELGRPCLLGTPCLLGVCPLEEIFP